MGSLAVVTSGILAHFILQERLTTFGWLGSTLSILGSVIIALNGPSEGTSTSIQAFQKKFLSVGFLVWGSLCLVSAAGMIFFVAPKYGKKNMLVYIGICSLLGGLSVACTSGLGGAILASIRGTAHTWNQWFTYFLLAFCVTTLLLEINYLNKALELFNSASVTAACEAYHFSSPCIWIPLTGAGLRRLCHIHVLCVRTEPLLRPGERIRLLCGTC